MRITTPTKPLTTMNEKRKSSRQSKQMDPEPLPAAGSTAAGEAEKEQIATLAYALWEAEGRSEGRTEEHWLKAEKQIRKRRDA